MATRTGNPHAPAGSNPSSGSKPDSYYTTPPVRSGSAASVRGPTAPVSAGKPALHFRAQGATPPQNASLLRRRRSYRENWNSALPQAQPRGDRRRHAQGPVGGSAVVPKRRRSSATRPCASAPPSYRRADPRRSAMDGLREAVRQIGTCTLIGARGARDRMRAQRQTASQAPSRSIPSVSPEALSFFRPCRARILGTDHPAPTRPAAL